MKILVAALALGLVTSGAFASDTGANLPALVKVVSLNPIDAAPTNFFCSDAMDEALKDKRNLIWNKIGIYTLDGLLIVAPIAAGGAAGFGLGYVVAPLFAGPTYSVMYGDFAGLFGAIGIGSASLNGSFDILETKEQRIAELKVLFDATTFTEKELMDADFEKRAAVAIASEEKIRSDRHLPPLTDDQKQAIRTETSYGTRDKTFIDTLVDAINNRKGPKMSYSEARQLVIDRGQDDSYCPMKKIGKRRKFLTMRKIVKNLQKSPVLSPQFSP